jgi:Fe-S cluster assembly protein SufD
MRDNALPRADDELWRRTKPELFHLPVNVSRNPLRVEGPGQVYPGVTVVPLGKRLKALPLTRIDEGGNLRSHGLSAAIGEAAHGGYLVHIGRDAGAGTVVAVDAALVAGGDSVVRNLVVIEDGVEVTLVERIADEAQAGQTLSGTRIVVGRNATLDYRRYWTWHRRVYAEVDMEIGEGSEVKLSTLVEGSGVAKIEERFRLAGRGSSLDELFVDKAQPGFRLDLFQETRHEAPGTRARVEARGVVWPRGYSLHHGLTKVTSGALDTDTYFTSRHLLVGNKARADAIPKMEILTDAVKAGHGATSGDLDRDALFYLMARGIPKDVARGMLIDGFLDGLHQRFPELLEMEEGNVAG